MKRKIKDRIMTVLGVILTIVLMLLTLTGIAIDIIEDDSHYEVHVKNFLQDTHQADSIMSLNRDSISAFMSVIIEANQTLVRNPEDCH